MNNRYFFKAKRLDNGEWTDGYLFNCWERSYILWGMINDNPNMVEVDPGTICQCTGLKDKNGKLIWENDIIKGSIPEIANEPERTGIVKFGLAGWIIDFKTKKYESKISRVGFCSFHNYEVIGNVFGNPELLEV